MPEKDRYRQRQEEGRCVSCGTGAPAAGHVRCADCLEAARTLESAKRAARQRAGLCRTCGRRPPAEGSPDCRPCLDRYASYRRAPAE